jgi:hypothetical protein
MLIRLFYHRLMTLKISLLRDSAQNQLFTYLFRIILNCKSHSDDMNPFYIFVKTNQ